MYNKCNKNLIIPPFYLLITVFLIQVRLISAQISAKIQSSNTVVSGVSNQILIVTFANIQIPSGSSILLQYSNPWTVSTATGGNPGDFCQTSCTMGTVAITINSAARTIQIINLFSRLISSGESRTIRYTLKNIINPSYAMTQNLILSLLDNAASLIDLTVVSVTVTPRSISCSVSRTSTVVSTTAQYTFTVNPSPLTLPSSTSVLMIFPSTWFNSAQSGTYNPSTSICRSAINPLISCSQINSNLNATNILTTSTGSSFSFNVTNIKNPGSEQVNNQLLFQFYSSGNNIALCYVPITGSTARTIPDLSMSMPGTLGSVIIGKINFTTTQLSRTTDLVQIQIPLQYDCSLLYTAFVYLNSQTVNRQSIINVKTNSTKNYITLQPFFTSPTALYRLQLYNIQLPKTSASIPQIKLSIIRNGALVASQTCCSTSYSTVSSSSGLSVTLSNNQVGMLSTHYITITSSSTILFPNDYTYILIQFDSIKYTLSSATYSCYIKNTLSIIHPITCTRNTTTSILLTNIATNNQSIKISDMLFTIGIDSVLTPVTLAPLSLFMVLLDANYNPIQNITTTYTLIPTKINNITVSAADMTTYSTTNYRFVINNTNVLTISLSIIIIFPQQIRISSTGTQCYINNTVLASSDCVVDITNSSAHKVTLVLPNSSPIPTGSLSSTNITITQVTNPLSLRQTSSFSVSLVDNSGQVIEALSQGIFITMSGLLSAFGAFAISTNNNYTMAVANYTVLYQLPVDIIGVYGASSVYVSSGIRIVIVLPSQYGCIATNSSTNKPCMISSTQTQILSTSLTATPAGTSLSFIIPSVTNPSTVTVASAITARLYLGGYLSIQQQYNGLNTFQASVLGYSISFAHYYVGQYNDIEIVIGSISNWRTHNSSRYLIIKPPAQFTVDSNLKLSTNQPTSTPTPTISSGVLQTVTISNTILSNNLSVTLSNIKNPASLAQIPTSTKFSIQYRDTSTNSLIAISNATTDVRFDLVCALPCRSCQPTNTSFCLSCYTAVSGILQKYLDYSANTCVTACSAGQFLSLVTTDLTCYTCASSCLTCLNISDNCTSCPISSSTYLYTGTNKCLTECPPQHYQNPTNRQCTLCTPPCLYCTGSIGTTCTLCISTYVLTVYPNATTTCTLSCPAGYYNNSNICANCSTNCTACTSNNQCTACISNYYLYNGSCLDGCPYGLYISIASGNKSCQGCQSPCLTCIDYSTYCVTCNITNTSTNKNLFTNTTSGNTSTCLTACPSQYYPNQYYICKPCIAPCLLCISPTECSTCVTGYYLYPVTKTCHSVCPTNTILQTSTQDCRECTSPCLQCVGSITNCLSCIQSYFLDTSINTCNQTCTLPFYAINRTCTRCAFPCATCTPLQPYKCTTCRAGYLLFGTSCYLAQCPDGSYKTSSNLTCSACTSGCLTCITTSSTCLSCYPGLYLYQQSCIPSCPTIPITYYQYQMQCIACQPECTSCISSPVQCASCSNPSLYFNQVTRQCTTNCTLPYYPSTDITNPSINLCVTCKLPCKTCTTTQAKCLSCHNGMYLYNEQCLQNCPSSTYPDMELNACVACSLDCVTCSSVFSCIDCLSGTYTFQGACYVSCPAKAPYPYLKYCRNCILDNCILCDEGSTNPVCLLCEPGYYLHQDKCLSSCPQNYQPDSVTSSLCLQTSSSVLSNFLKKLQKFKVYLMPGMIFFVLSLLFVISYAFGLGQYQCCRQSSTSYLIRPQSTIWTNAIHSILAIPQTISLIAYLTYLILYPEAYYHSYLFNIVLYVLFGGFYFLNIVHFVIVLRILKKDKMFNDWLRYGIKDQQDPEKNYRRYVVVMVFVLVFNRKIFYIIFSGLWRIPVTCCQISLQTIQQISKTLKIITIFGIIVVQLPLIAYSVLTLVIQKYNISNYKLFYGTIDLSAINLICIIVEVVFLAKKFIIPSLYKKYILQKVSVQSLPALTQKIFQQLPAEDDDDELKLHRSNSAEGLRKQSQQMKAVQYYSTFDANQYEDPQFLESHQIQNAIQDGKYRRKNLKKKKKKYGIQLDVISEDSQQQQQQFKAKQKNKKKKKQGKRKKIGYLNNYIYWQPPQKQIKKKPQKQFKLHQKQIMEKIKQKQSDFDTITRNDIIFREDPMEFNSSRDSDPDFQIQETRRVLNHQYQTFINKNYAKRRHLG